VNRKVRFLALLALLASIVTVMACDDNGGGGGGGVVDAPSEDDASGGGSEGGQQDDESRPDEVPGLREEIYFVPGGGGWDSCLMPPPPDLPAIMEEPYPPIGEEGTLCLFGFPLGEEITVELHTPDGEYVGHDVFQEEGWEVDGVPVSMVDLWWPAGLPAGEWHIVAQSPSAHAEGTFEIVYRDQLISTVPEGGINPFENHTCDSYRAGERVFINGARFDPNAAVPLAIYHETQKVNEKGFTIGELVYSQMVTADSRGYFQTVIGIESSDPSGYYRIVVARDPAAESYSSIEGACFRVQ